MRKTTTRALLAVTTAFAVLMALAAPASASPGTITSGTATVQTVNPPENYVFDLTPGTPPPPGAPCPAAPAAGIDVNFTTNTITPGALGKSQVRVPPVTGAWYWVNTSIVSGSFVINMGPPATVTATVTLQISLHPIGGCDPKSPAVCTLRTTIALSGTWSGAAPNPPGTAVVSGGPANINRFGACAAPFATRFPGAPPFAQFSVSNLTIVF